MRHVDVHTESFHRHLLNACERWDARGQSPRFGARGADIGGNETLRQTSLGLL